jgi:hypothetical protein
MSVDKILDEMRGGFVKKGPQCSVGLIFTSLGGDEREALEKALVDSTIELVAVSRWLLKNGHDAKPHTLGRHRRKECRCDQWLTR